jgi:hypothetical protein
MSRAVTLVAKEAIVTLLEIEAVTEPIWFVPAANAGKDAKDAG